MKDDVVIPSENPDKKQRGNDGLQICSSVFTNCLRRPASAVWRSCTAIIGVGHSFVIEAQFGVDDVFTIDTVQH